MKRIKHRLRNRKPRSKPVNIRLPNIEVVIKNAPGIGRVVISGLLETLSMENAVIPAPSAVEIKNSFTLGGPQRAELTLHILKIKTTPRKK